MRALIHKNRIYLPSLLALMIAAESQAASSCNPGFYDPAGGSNCDPAPLGRFVSGSGAVAAELCPIGRYAGFTAMTACAIAPVGYYVDNAEGQALAHACPAGTYNDEFGKTSCKQAPIGSFVDLVGQSAASVCPTGFYTDATGQSSCSVVPAGSYAVAGIRQLCTAGNYSNTSGSTSCTPASSGFFVANPGATTEVQCAKGTYSATPGNSSCVDSPAGFYVDDLGQTKAMACIVGSFSTAKSESCTLAPAGYFVDQDEAPEALPCAPGSYTDQLGQTNCTMAPRGRYVPAPAAITALECPAGSFSDQFGSVQCKPAPIGYFVSQSGSTSAQMCGAGTFSRATGSTSCETATYGQISFANNPYSLHENDNSLSVSVNRENGSDGELNVDVNFVDGTAIAGRDYVMSPVHLTFANGETVKQINITPINNAVFNADREFQLMLNHWATLGAVNQPSVAGENTSTSVVIINDDAAPSAGSVGFNLRAQNVNENSGTVSVEVIRRDGAGAISLMYNTEDGSAAAGSRYQAKAGVLDFAAGEMQKTINLRLLDDQTFTSPQSFYLHLSNPQAGALLDLDKTEIRILDNETAPASGIFEIENSDYRVTENGSAVEIKIKRINGSQGEASVDLISASSGRLNNFSTTASFAAGETEKIVSVQIDNDSIFQAEQRPLLKLANPVGAILGEKINTRLIIMDDELPPASGVVSLSGSEYKVSENAGTLSLVLARNQANQGTLSVTLSTQDMSAISALDYLPLDSQIVTFADGELTKTISLSIIDDDQYKGTRLFTLILSSANSENVGWQSTAQVAITENDSPPATGVLQFSTASYSANEIDKKATLVVTRTGGDYGAASVNFQISNNTAVNNTDFTHADGMLEFANGEVEKNIEINITDDGVVEETENFTVSLTNPNGAALGAQVSAQVSILDKPMVKPVDDSKSGGGLVSLWWLAFLALIPWGRTRKNSV